MQVREVATLTGISVRTLHYYDEIGLLIPEKSTVSGYRHYSEHDLERLQQILFFKNVGFSLKEIKQMIGVPDFNQFEALQLHRKMLMKKRDHIDTLIKTVSKTIEHQKGEISMTKEERFSGFNFSKNEYEKEARERWGNEAVDKSQRKIDHMSTEEKGAFEQKFNQIYRDLASIRHVSPASNEAQAKIETWYQYLNKIGNYSYEAFANLGEMYVTDERFTKNIDQFGDGLAQFMCDAMNIYANDRK